MSSTLAGVLRLAAESTEDCSGGPLGHHGLTVPCPNRSPDQPLLLTPREQPPISHNPPREARSLTPCVALPILVTSVTEKDVVAGALPSGE